MATNSLPRNYPRVNLSVTEADIATAVRGDSAHCVIADALRRQLGATRVEVDLQLITFTDPNREVRVSFLTPEICQMHLISFDQGWTVEPFEFYLRSPIRIRQAGRGAGRPMGTKDAVATERSAKIAELVEKETAGTLTPRERGTLTKMRATDEARANQRPRERKRMVDGADENGRPVFVGGKDAVAPPAVLSNAKGRRRHYGARLAKPGVAAAEL